MTKSFVERVQRRAERDISSSRGAENRFGEFDGSDPLDPLRGCTIFIFPGNIGGINIL